MPRQPNQLSDADLRLILAPGIGPITRRKLIERFGSAEAVVNAPAIALESIRGIGAESARSLREALDGSDPHAEREAMTAYNAAVIIMGDDDYPPLLAAIDDPPSAIWIRGSLTAADQLAIAIVGSRRCSAYGREQASRFAALLAQSGLTIVSGGAAGIDGEAHRAALRVRSRTIVVQGCGLARNYPEEHRELFERIVAEESGAIVSEHPMHVPPLAKNFPKRNRIISGLALGVLVIEAAQRSGALITARLAAEHGREVAVLPGRVDSAASAGCLKLLRDGGAAMALDHTDVLTQLESASHLLRGAAELAGAQSNQTAPPPSLLDLNLNDAQQSIVNVLLEAQDPLLVDQIAARTQIPMSRLLAELTMLQIRGRVHKDHRGVRLRRDEASGKCLFSRDAERSV